MMIFKGRKPRFFRGGKTKKPVSETAKGMFSNQLLVAMPSMIQGIFARSVVYICNHNEDGAMGIVINKRLNDVDFTFLLDQMSLPHPLMEQEPIIYRGGPMGGEHGLVLHSDDFIQKDTIRFDKDICMTGSLEILKAIAGGTGPNRSIFALGHAGWGPGQLEAEIQANAWLSVPANADILYSTSLDTKWDKALEEIGVTPHSLSMQSGSA